MVDHITVHGGPEVTQLAHIGHLTGVVVLAHVVSQAVARVVVLLTDAAQQDIGLGDVDLGMENTLDSSKLKLT